MTSIPINLSDEELSLLKKRGEDNFLSTKEQIEDIVRRSLISYQAKLSGKRQAIKVDDKLVAAFSRDGRGRKKGRKNKPKVNLR